MKIIAVLLALLTFSVQAYVPDFKYWDIRGNETSTDLSIFEGRYYDNKTPVPYGSYVYKTLSTDTYYKDIVIVNAKHNVILPSNSGHATK
ncbi:hypothetical protein HF650_14595 [Kosakonia sp. SMBL-WEM22]|uniref:hypothetical protein n=1 Tax=Kosakonia sp. SMBL-WEM22 TaxID=2725560 RepID=UPI0016592DCB|nr:hypothetical protein [Kosakonia sp. SMBL-WEM22]QNQ20892.1 hypothetical protein HF650_14595 [Kosakonia sp. SMBL-WEM22]